MSSDLVRVEGAVSATASGDLSWDRWPLDSIIALGFAGRKNPLGFAVVRFLSEPPTSMNLWGVVLTLAKEMQVRGVSSDGINDKAFKAFEWWNDSRCSVCHGRGVFVDGRVCPDCNGSGQRVTPSAPDWMSVGVSCLLEAEQRMEGQLWSRLKKW